MFRCTFRPKDHTYYFSDGLRRWKVPSVTQILKATGGGPDLSRVHPDVLEAARSRGERVHAAIENAAKCGMMVIQKRDHDIEGYLSAFWQFVNDANVRVIATEKKVYHEAFGYAGKMDLYAKAFNKRAVIETKTYELDENVGEQGAGYFAALCSMGEKPKAIYGLELKANGEYRLQEFNAYKYTSRFMRRLRTVKELPEWKNQKYEPRPRAKSRSKPRVTKSPSKPTR